MQPASAAPTLAEFIDGLELYLDPILCGGIAGIVLGFLGVYIVLRRMVLVPLAITHASSLGVVLAFDLKIHVGASLLANPVLGAFVFGLGATLIFVVDPRRLNLTQESLIGMVYIVTAGLSVLIGAHISQESHEISAIIFGTAVMVNPSDLMATAVSGGLVMVMQLWFRRGFVFVSFDREGARVQDLPVRLLDALLLISIGLMVSVTTRALGAMPVFAFCVLPAMGALSVFRRLSVALFVAAAFGLVAAIAGYVGAFFLQYPVGASQTVMAALITVLAGMAGPLVRRIV